MRKKRTSKPKTRGPNEAPLIGENPQEARKRLLELKAEFDAAHADGMHALKKRDFEGLSRAIERERDIIKRQEDRIATRRKKT